VGIVGTAGGARREVTLVVAGTAENSAGPRRGSQPLHNLAVVRISNGARCRQSRERLNVRFRARARVTAVGRKPPVLRPYLTKRERHDAERDESRASDPGQAVTLAQQLSADQSGEQH